MTGLDNATKKWIKEATKYFTSSWGLDESFAEKIALFYLYLSSYGLNPRITSGFRSPEKQEELKRRFAAGDPSIRYKPAEKSQHMAQGLFGKPAALAVDIATSNEAQAAQIAKALGLKAGYFFNDPVHFSMS
jgi:hypothetical protein